LREISSESISLSNPLNFFYPWNFFSGKKTPECDRVPKVCALFDSMPNAKGCTRGQIKYRCSNLHCIRRPVKRFERMSSYNLIATVIMAQRKILQSFVNLSHKHSTHWLVVQN